MQDLANMFLQAFQKYHFSQKLEDLCLEIKIDDLCSIYFTIENGQISLSEDFCQHDILLKGTISQWTTFFLSQGKERLIHIEGNASKLSLFQQECEALIERYKDDLPSFLEMFIANTSERLTKSLHQEYLSGKQFEKFSKRVIQINHRLEKLERELQ